MLHACPGNYLKVHALLAALLDLHTRNNKVLGLRGVAAAGGGGSAVIAARIRRCCALPWIIRCVAGAGQVR